MRKISVRTSWANLRMEDSWAGSFGCVKSVLLSASSLSREAFGVVFHGAGPVTWGLLVDKGMKKIYMSLCKSEKIRPGPALIVLRHHAVSNC